jgi:hypothetical protein
MFKLNQLSLSVATIAATVTIGAVCSTTAQAAIVTGSVSGVWEYDWYGSSGWWIPIGDAFTATYTYNTDDITRTDYSNWSGYTRYFQDSVPLLSLVLSSDTFSHEFDFNTVSSIYGYGAYSYLQWWDYQYADSQYETKGTQLYAADFPGSLANYFYAYEQAGKYWDGTPWSSSSASASSYDYITGTLLKYPYTYSGVTFSDPHTFPPPATVPTPALLPGLIGMGMAAVRKRKANQAQEALEEQSA